MLSRCTLLTMNVDCCRTAGEREPRRGVGGDARELAGIVLRVDASYDKVSVVLVASGRVGDGGAVLLPVVRQPSGYARFALQLHSVAGYSGHVARVTRKVERVFLRYRST